MFTVIYNRITKKKDWKHRKENDGDPILIQRLEWITEIIRYITEQV